MVKSIYYHAFLRLAVITIIPINMIIAFITIITIIN